jgi:hypothetical protein
MLGAAVPATWGLLIKCASKAEALLAGQCQREWVSGDFDYNMFGWWASEPRGGNKESPRSLALLLA